MATSVQIGKLLTQVIWQTKEIPKEKKDDRYDEDGKLKVEMQEDWGRPDTPYGAKTPWVSWDNRDKHVDVQLSHSGGYQYKTPAWPINQWKAIVRFLATTYKDDQSVDLKLYKTKPWVLRVYAHGTNNWSDRPRIKRQKALGNIRNYMN